MQVHKITVMVLDDDEAGADFVIDALESQRYRNHCMTPVVMECHTREISYDDEHPLNMLDTRAEAFRELFSTSTPTPFELAKRYDYGVTFSKKDGWVATVKEFPSLSSIDKDNAGVAINELMDVVSSVIDDMRKNKETIPEPHAQ